MQNIPLICLLSFIVVIAINASGIPPNQPPPEYIISKGKTATADASQSGNGPGLANDGDTGTRWCTPNGNAGHWWKVDLGNFYSIVGAKVMWEQDGKVYKYKVEVSNDNANWSLALDRTTNTLTTQWQTKYFTAVARYVRVTVTGLASGVWASFFEFQVLGEWDLKFSDEFEGTALDTTKWGRSYPWGRTHNHRAYMADGNVTISNGTLKIKAENRRDPSAPYSVVSGGQTYVLDYTSGAIHSQWKMSLTRGYIEGRFRVPGIKGFWPAFWMLNNTGEWPPEIDIFEVLGSSNTILRTNYHWGPDWQTHYSYYQETTTWNLSTWWRNYGVEWNADSMRWYLDNAAVGNTFTNATAISQANDMHLIINLAVGGWEADPDGTTTWPSYLECDWVRMWQQSGARPSVAFTAAASQDLESVTTANIPVRLSAAATKTTNVNYAIKGGTARSGVDYTHPNGTLAFAKGDTTKNIAISIVNDKQYEPDETIIITLTSSDEAALLGALTHTYTIKNDDRKLAPVYWKVR